MELTISNLIKIIIGVLVVGVVIFGVYTFFRDHVIEFFKVGNETANVFLAMVK
ncbi:MAG: hypothetical protein WDZ69_03085 [Candidatus Pacearchaeota archaeon]